jgi:iron complex transport system substrate-binding protein
LILLAGFFLPASRLGRAAQAATRSLRVALAVLLLCPYLVSAAAAQAPAPAVTASNELSVRDDQGREIHLDAAAQRIVSLAPHATELIFEVGAGAALVAVSDASDYPEAAQSLPHVGGSAGLDLERIVALRPDLVVAWSSGNSQGQIAALRQAGLNVFESDPHDIEQIASSLQRLGTLTGHQQMGAERARELRSAIAALAAAEHGRRSVSVFYEVWDQPLYTLGESHFISQLMQVCGARNLFSDVDALAPEVSPEAVVARKPDLIVTDPKEVDTLRAAWLARGLAAASRPEQVVGINPDWLIRATSRIVLGARALCHAVDQRRAASGR